MNQYSESNYLIRGKDFPGGAVCSKFRLDEKTKWCANCGHPPTWHKDKGNQVNQYTNKLIRIEAILIDHDSFLCGPKLDVHVMIGNKGYGFTKGLCTPLTESYFDIIWQDMGDAFKQAIKENEKNDTL